MDDKRISRRIFTGKILGTAISVSFLETLFSGCRRVNEISIPETNNIIDVKASTILNHWAIELNEICGDLRTDKISQVLWQEQVDKLFNRIELEDLLKFIDFEKLTSAFEYPDLGVSTKNIDFPKLAGLPQKTVFHKKIFGMRKGRAIVPHGHKNMASAHLILDGTLRLRHFNRINEDDKHVFVTPSINRLVKAGDHSSISDDRDNVHWFVAESESAFSFDVIMLDLGGAKYDIQNLDINESEPLGDGILRAKKIDVDTALQKYGKDHHQGGIEIL